MNAEQKKEPKQPLKIDLSFEETLAAMLQVAPEAGTKKPPIKKPTAKTLTQKKDRKNLTKK